MPNSEVSQKCGWTEFGGIYPWGLSLAGFLHSHQHPEFSEFNVLISQARVRLCASLLLLLLFFYINPSQMWTAVSLRLKTEEIGIYLSSFPQMNLACQPSRHFCSLSRAQSRTLNLTVPGVTRTAGASVEETRCSSSLPHTWLPASWPPPQPPHALSQHCRSPDSSAAVGII